MLRSHHLFFLSILRQYAESRPKHVVQLISFITDQLVVFWPPYTVLLC